MADSGLVREAAIAASNLYFELDRKIPLWKCIDRIRRERNLCMKSADITSYLAGVGARTLWNEDQAKEEACDISEAEEYDDAEG